MPNIDGICFGVISQLLNVCYMSYERQTGLIIAISLEVARQICAQDGKLVAFEGNMIVYLPASCAIPFAR